MNARPKLSVVIDPDAELRALFAAHDEARRQLATLDETIADRVRAYSFARGFCVPMRKEAVRRDVEG